MKHLVKSHMLSRGIDVCVVGAGGTGSHVIQNLAALHYALLGLGHPAGLNVTLVDNDLVSESNVGRQCFFPSDIGQPKSEVLVNRANMGWMTNWKAVVGKVGTNIRLPSADIVIGCVDNREARKNIISTFTGCYYLDFGNRKHDGQVVLGEIPRSWEGVKEDRLPHVGELFPEAINPELEGQDDTPSCSLAEALEKQSLFINKALATHGINLLAKLLTKGEIETHGLFLNLESERTSPLPIDPATWERFGFKHVNKRQRKKKSS